MDVERNARTQVLYREVNNRIRALQESFGEPASIEILCECGRSCVEHIEVSVADYDRARAEPTYFLTTPEHHAPEVDRLAEEHDAWLLVEAIGAAAAIARE